MLARDNPFATHHLERIPFRAPGVTVETLLDKFERMGMRGSIVGPEGSGKTTLLEELGGELRRRGKTVLHLRGRQVQFGGLIANPKAIVLLDESEALGRLRWRVFLACASRTCGLLVTAHRPGRLPVLLECSTSPNLFEEIVAELAGSEIERWRNMLGGIYTRHDGNIREALLELYDLHALRGVARSRGTA